MTEDESRKVRFEARTMGAQIMVAHGRSLDAEAFGVFARGLIEGLRDGIAGYSGDRAAFEVVRGVADGLAKPLLSAAGVTPPAEQAR